MLPTLLSKSINSLIFCLTTLLHYAYGNKCHDCKPNKFFILSLSNNCENISFAPTGYSDFISNKVIFDI